MLWHRASGSMENTQNTTKMAAAPILRQKFLSTRATHEMRTFV